MTDYDYIVESFYTEYKLNVDELSKILLEYKHTESETEKTDLYNRFKKLYPEYEGKDLIGLTNESLMNNKTVKKILYFVQPPRDEATGRPTKFYSLKSHMLTELRNQRKDVKKRMKEASSRNDKVNEVRFNAMQNAIKVIMNTEYGASGNKLFAHYDPDIAGAVTYLSRTLIGFLTKTLHSTTFYVDKQFLDDTKSYIERLMSIECIKSVSKVDNPTDEFLFDNRVRTLRRIFDDIYKPKTYDIYKIEIEKSSVIYQDTDSNYYINPYIQNYYIKEHMTPVDIKECMTSMLAHNDFLNSLAVNTINRTPVGLGFEGAFIICRYFYRKKKYYGKQYDPSMLSVIPAGEKWTPKRSCEPLPNGDYIYLDNSILLSNGTIASHGKQKDSEAIPINYLDYIKGQGIKCTGVNLARRDQYKFINYYHMVVIQKDMKLIRKDDDDEWTLIKEKSMLEVINDIIERYRNLVQVYMDVADGKITEVPVGTFKLVDFSRPKPYEESKQGSIQKIISRMKEDEDAAEYMPKNGERINVVVVMNDVIKEARLRGTAGMGETGERSFTVDELLAKTKRENPDDSPELIDAKACSKLDFKYYLLSLASAMALYIVDERFPSEVDQINQGLISDKEGEELIDKLQKKIGKEILDKYYPTKTKTNSNINKIQKESEKYFKKAPTRDNSKRYKYTKDTYVNMQTDEIIEKNKARIRNNAEEKLRSNQIAFNAVSNVYRVVKTDMFLNPRFENKIEESIYEQYKDDDNLYEEALRRHSDDMVVYKRILEELS